MSGLTGGDVMDRAAVARHLVGLSREIHSRLRSTVVFYSCCMEDEILLDAVDNVEGELWVIKFLLVHH